MFNDEMKEDFNNTDHNNAETESVLSADVVEDMIERLPENFPQALPIIQNDIAPIIAECDAGLKDHYISLIRKRTKAASKRAVQLEIENAVIQVTEEDLLPAEETGKPCHRPCRFNRWRSRLQATLSCSKTVSRWSTDWA